MSEEEVSPGRGYGMTRQGVPVPRQLPPAVADFTGRVTEATGIRHVLGGTPAHGDRVVLVTGMGGVGKTALATHTAQAVSPSYPDGQLHIDLRGADGTPVDPGLVLSSFLRALGRSDSSIPNDPDQRGALYQELLAHRRVLIVLDNAAHAEQVLPLLPQSPDRAVIITSRDSLADLPAGLRLSLGPLPEDDAVELFGRLVGEERLRTEPDAAQVVLAACGGLPLAVRVIGSRLAARPDWALADVAERLGDEHRRLSELAVEAVAVESVFSLAYSRLDERARRAFRLLAFPARSGFDTRTASRVLAAPEPEAGRALDELVSAGLLSAPAMDRYRYHDLVLLFAHRLSVRTDSASDRHAALGRLLDHHLVAAAGSYAFLMPGHIMPGTSYPMLRDGPRFEDLGSVQAWASAHLDDILRLITMTASSHTARATTLLLMLRAVARTAHRWRDVIPVATAVSEAATASGDQRSEGRARYMLAAGLTQVGRLEEAEANILRALPLTERLDDDYIHAMALNLYGIIVGWSDPLAGMRHHHRAAQLAHEQGNTALEAAALGNIVQTRLLMPGMDDETVEMSKRQLELYRENGDRYGETTGLYRHGQVLLRRGLPAAAIAVHHRTLELLREGEQDWLQGGTHMRLSEAYVLAGQPTLAVQHAEQALAVSREVRHDHLTARSMATLGDALAALGRPEEARSYWRRAAASLRDLGVTVEAEQVARRLAG